MASRHLFYNKIVFLHYVNPLTRLFGALEGVCVVAQGHHFECEVEVTYFQIAKSREKSARSRKKICEVNY